MFARCVLLLSLVACQRAKPQPIEDKPPTVIQDVSTTGVPTCDEYLRRVAACTKLSPAMRETLAHGAGAWKLAGSGASSGCADVAKLAGPSLSELGC